MDRGIGWGMGWKCVGRGGRKEGGGRGRGWGLGEKGGGEGGVVGGPVVLLRELPQEVLCREEGCLHLLEATVRT